MKTEKREVYISDDGKVFDTVEACQKHEAEIAAQQKRIENLSVYQVFHGFDGTEGRGYGGVTYIVADPKTSFAALLQYCFNRFGKPLSAWYGDGFYEEWMLHKREKQTATDVLKLWKQPHSGIGSTSAKVDLVFLSASPIDHPVLNPVRDFPWPPKKEPRP